MNVDTAGIPSAVALEADGPVVSRPVTVAGHELVAYAESEPLFERIVADIGAAKSRVWVETYTIADDEVGRRVARALIDRASAGLDVRLLYDAVGSPGISTAFLTSLVAAGVKVHAYHTIWDALRRRSVLTIFNRRDHRKVLAIDDQIAYFGGMNIIDHGPTAAEPGWSPPERRWRDIHVRLVGPQAREVAESFDRSWRRAHHRPVRRRSRAYRRGRLPGSGESIRFFDSGPGLRYSRAARVFLRLTRRARRRIVIAMAYFLPTGRVLRALLRARRRGVRVVVILPGASDVKLVQWAMRYLYAQLLRRGVRLFERQQRMLHSKTMVVDHAWTVVGSCNLDPRSMWINLEFLAVIRSPAFAKEIARLCAAELRRSRRIRPSQAVVSWGWRFVYRLAWGLRWWL